MQCPETQAPMARPHPTPPKHHADEPQWNCAEIADLTKRCAYAVKSSSTLQHLTCEFEVGSLSVELSQVVTLCCVCRRLAPRALELYRARIEAKRACGQYDSGCYRHW